MTTRCYNTFLHRKLWSVGFFVPSGLPDQSWHHEHVDRFGPFCGTPDGLVVGNSLCGPRNIKSKKRFFQLPSPDSCVQESGPLLVERNKAAFRRLPLTHRERTPESTAQGLHCRTALYPDGFECSFCLYRHLCVSTFVAGKRTAYGQQTQNTEKNHINLHTMKTT